MTEGTRGEEFMVIVEGAVRVSKKGRKAVALGAGDWVGEIALISDVPRTATVTTTSPVRLLVVTGRDFKRLLQRMPGIALKVLAKAAERLTTDSA